MIHHGGIYWRIGKRGTRGVHKYLGLGPFIGAAHDVNSTIMLLIFAFMYNINIVIVENC